MSYQLAMHKDPIRWHQLTNELSNSKKLICLPSEPVKRLLTDLIVNELEP